MLTYNTQQAELILPEYGRNIQRMVEHCLTIEDREERNHCARSIIKCMAQLNPEVKNSTDDEMKLWDHLAIMSGFRLDVDAPGEMITAEKLTVKPESISYGQSDMRFRQYGKTLEAMIDKAAEMEDTPERQCLIESLANQMKKDLVISLGEEVDDGRVFDDLAHLSRGRLIVSKDELRLHEYKAPPRPVGKKKKK